jgi:cytochrome c556
MRKMGLCTTMTLSIVLMLTATTGVCADDVKQIVNARQEQLKILERTAKALGHELERSAPDRAAVARDATKIAALAVELPNWFSAGSGPTVAKTAAKADVWTRPAEFRKAEDSLIFSARQLARLATSDDPAAVRRQAKLLSETCDDCHNAFRNRWLLLRPW